MATISVVLDPGRMTTTELQACATGLQEIYRLALMSEAEQSPRGFTLPYSLEDVPGATIAAARQLRTSSEVVYERIEMHSPFLAWLAVPGSGAFMIGYLRLVRDWSSNREKRRLENDLLRAQIEAFRRSQDLPNTAEAVALTMDVIEVSRLPPVLDVDLVEAGRQGPSRGGRPAIGS